MKSIKSERSDGYIVFYYRRSSHHQAEIASATCNNLNVSSSFEYLLPFFRLNVLTQKTILDYIRMNISLLVLGICSNILF